VGGAEIGEVEVDLLGEPGFGGASKNFGKANGHFGRDAALAVDEFGESGASHAKSGGGLSNVQTQRLDAIAQDETAGVGGFFMGMIGGPSIFYFHESIFGDSGKF
jgi:hypothetical protein